MKYRETGISVKVESQKSGDRSSEAEAPIPERVFPERETVEGSNGSRKTEDRSQNLQKGES